MRDQVPVNLRFADPGGLMVLAEDFGAVLAEMGDWAGAARLLGAADAMRKRHVHPRESTQEAEIEAPFARVRAGLAPEDWQREYACGLDMSVEDALKEAHSKTG
ncbi:MAG: hypothetical protein WKF82_13720 [Nocardioidaceae bacterium]